MGAFSTKEWREVLDESPTSGGHLLDEDPRSISDDVSRTPIQVDDTPTAKPSLRQKTLQSLVDPRSPSGITRTPILIQEESQSGVPRRGMTRDPKNINAAKIDFDKVLKPKTEVEEEPPTTTSTTGGITDGFDDTANISTENQENEPSVEDSPGSTTGLLTPTTVKSKAVTTLQSGPLVDCRSPLVIENEDVIRERRPLGEIVDANKAPQTPGGTMTI